MLTGYQRGMCPMHHSIMSPRNLSEASMGKMTSFWACTSLSMSAWMVPRRRATQPGPNRLLAAPTNIARMAGAGAFIVIDTDASLADLSEQALMVAVEPVQGRPVECRGQPGAPLVAGKVMEPAVRVLGEPEAGEEAGGVLPRG